jgi:hypothetical protein
MKTDHFTKPLRGDYKKIGECLSCFWIAYFLILSGQRKKTPVVVWM